MRKVKPVAIAVLLIVIVSIIAYLALNYTEEGNALIATSFVKNEATYEFDGIPETFRSTGTVAIECPYCWEFRFEYQSRNSGYGDRRDATVAPVITNHSARIIMERGAVNIAVLDDAWDMKAQKPYRSPSPEDPQERRR